MWIRLYNNDVEGMNKVSITWKFIDYPF